MTQDQDADRARREAADWLILLREEPADESIAADFTAWLARDATHASAWASMTRTFAAVEALPPADPRHWPAPATAKLGWRAWVSSPRWAGALVAAAACFALLLGPTLAVRLQADAATGAGEMRALRLADGSMVRLGPDSAISLDHDPRQRHVRLISGQAWFEVVHDPARPFTVSAGSVSTRVLGTGFDVRRLGARTEVAVRHGHVQVSEEGHPPHDLLAGDWLRIAGDHHTDQGHQQPDLAGSWQDGSVLARNRSVAEVVDEIRPWYRGRILLTHDALAQARVTGVYDVHDPLGALKAAVTPRGGRITRITPWLVIVSGA